MLDERNLVAKTVRVHVWATLCLVLGLERLTYMPIRPTLPMHVSTPGVRSSPPSNASVGIQVLQRWKESLTDCCQVKYATQQGICSWPNLQVAGTYELEGQLRLRQWLW